MFSTQNYPQLSNSGEKRDLQSGIKTSFHGLPVIRLSLLLTDLEINPYNIKILDILYSIGTATLIISFTAKEDIITPNVLLMSGYSR